MWDVEDGIMWNVEEGWNVVDGIGMLKSVLCMLKTVGIVKTVFECSSRNYVVCGMLKTVLCGMF